MKVKISELKPHPFNKTIFKDLEGEEFEALKEDIKKRGLQIIPDVSEDNVIICGHQRVRACQELGWEEIEVRVKKGTEDELREHLIKDNVLRRQLNDYEISEAGRELERIINKRWGGDRTSGTPVPLEEQGRLRDEVAKTFGISGRTYDRIKEVRDKIDLVNDELREKWEDGKIKANAILGDIKKIESETPDWIRYLDVWNFKENTGEGISNMPPEIVKNLLYYYTEEGDLIYDCFAGSGQTLEIAKELNRKCICSDISPTNNSIIKWNVDDDFSNFPKDLSKVKLIFLDPPYWNMIDYGDGWSNLSIIEFYAKFDSFVKNLKGIGRKDVKIALLIMPLKKEDYYDLGFECSKIFQNNGFKIEQRLCVPLLRNWSIDARLKTSKENKEILTSSLRDLIVYGINYDTNTTNFQREIKQI